MAVPDLSRRRVLQFGAAATVPVWAPRAAHARSSREASQIRVDVAILGGGAGGLHTAYQLSKGASAARSDKPGIVLVEADHRLGGRIHDVALDPARPDRVFGTGALRVMQTQEYVFDLAEELGITLEQAPWRDDRLSARGFVSDNSDGLNELAYPLVTKEHVAGSGFDTEAAFYDDLRFGPLRSRAGDFPDMRSYARAVLGTQGFQFLVDMYRFRADFAAPVDARGYLEYLDEEWDVCCTPSYPVGGMSQFIVRMAAAARRQGVQVIVGDPVLNISRRGGEFPYEITTSERSIRARRLVIAIDPHGLSEVSGSVTDEIKSSEQYGDLLGIKVATVAQRWPFPWWLEEPPGPDVRRAWTTEHALNSLEIPLSPYVANQVVTRTVYDDDPRTTDFWELTAQRGTAQVEAEIMRGLTYLFPDLTIPAPLATVTRIWPAGWYWLRGGTRFSNADIADWAVEPLPGQPVSLVGEAYHPQRSGWSDAAYKSSIRTLRERFGRRSEAALAAAHRREPDACTTERCRRHARA